MKFKIAMTSLALFMFASTAGLATAQDTTKTTHKKTRTLSGCLQKGEDANEYNLTTSKEAPWYIKSDSSKLGDHLGHTVRITGAVSPAAMPGDKENATNTAKAHLTGNNSTPHSHLT